MEINLKQIGSGAVIGLLVGAMGMGLAMPKPDIEAENKAFLDNWKVGKEGLDFQAEDNPEEFDLDAWKLGEVGVEFETGDNEGSIDAFLTGKGLSRKDIDDLKSAKDKLDMVLENLDEYEGDLTFIDFDDIDDDEREEVIKYLDFVNQAKIMAIDYLEDEAFDELDGENYPESEDEFDKKELEDLDIEDDLFKIGIVGVDYEDGDARISLPFEFEDEDGNEFSAVAKIKIKDGEVDDMDIEDIEAEE